MTKAETWPIQDTGDRLSSYPTRQKSGIDEWGDTFRS